jgi:hypothetical protein
LISSSVRSRSNFPPTVPALFTRTVGCPTYRSAYEYRTQTKRQQRDSHPSESLQSSHKSHSCLPNHRHTTPHHLPSHQSTRSRPTNESRLTSIILKRYPVNHYDRHFHHRQSLHQYPSYPPCSSRNEHDLILPFDSWTTEERTDGRGRERGLRGSRLGRAGMAGNSFRSAGEDVSVGIEG